MLSVPPLAPREVGIKLTRIVQLWPGLSVVPQLLAWLKLAVTVMPLIVNGASPLFVKLTD
jgi:hypothetical protein